MWKGDVIIFGHLPCHFSSAVSLLREEDDMFKSWQLLRICSGGKVNGPQVFLPQVNLAFLHVMFSNPLESFSLAVTTCSHTMC